MVRGGFNGESYVENQLFQTCAELFDERDVEAETGDKFLDA
jgi:hypothetical protein